MGNVYGQLIVMCMAGDNVRDCKHFKPLYSGSSECKITKGGKCQGEKVI